MSSGRCWIFACLNVMRLKVMKKLNLPATFELSQSYLFFFDKLERAQFFLDTVLETVDLVGGCVGVAVLGWGGVGGARGARCAIGGGWRRHHKQLLRRPVVWKGRTRVPCKRGLEYHLRVQRTRSVAGSVTDTRHTTNDVRLLACASVRRVCV
jgi:hypothetical protein